MPGQKTVASAAKKKAPRQPRLSRADIERQARFLAEEGRKAEPGMQAVYWFPDDSEVRLVELVANIPLTLSGEVEPFYFRKSLEDKMPAPSALAMIRPDELGKLKLPEGWGTWDNARELKVDM